MVARALKTAMRWGLCLWRVLWLFPLIAAGALLIAVAFVGFGPKLGRVAVEMIFDL